MRSAYRLASSRFRHRAESDRVDGIEGSAGIRFAASQPVRNAAERIQRSLLQRSKSITAGRLPAPDEMIVDAADRGQPNHIPFLNRHSVWWAQMKESCWPKRATREQKETLKRDLSIVLRIIKELD